MVALKDFGSFLSSAVAPSSQTAMWTKMALELEDEILELCKNSPYPRFSLANLARTYRVPYDVLEEIAQRVCLQYFKVDIDQREFQSAVKLIEEIEQLPDPGVREFKIAKAAKRFGMSKRQLMEAYNKAVCARSPLKIRTVREFKQEFQKPIDWLVRGWLPKGVTVLLHAFGGVGKTLLVYHLLECLLKGKPWNGCQVEQGDALLIQVDEPELITADRLDIRGIEDHLPLRVISDWTVENIHRLEAQLAENPPKLLIVDSITAVNRNSIFSENDTEYARPILQIREMANRLGTTVILIHHSNAEGNSRGTKAIHNSVDEVWSLTQVVQEGYTDDRLLTVQKCRLGRSPGRYRFAFEEDYSFRYLGEQRGDAFDEEDPTQPERIRLWLSEPDNLGKRFTPGEIAEHVNLNKDSTRRALTSLWERGLIQRSRKRGSAYMLYSIKSPDQTVTLRNVTTDQGSDPLIGCPIAFNPPDRATLQETDRAIGQNAKNFSERDEKKRDFSRSPDRFAGNPNKQEQQEAIGQTDRLPQKTDRPIAFEPNPLQPATNQLSQEEVSLDRKKLEKGQAIEVFLHNRWIAARYLGAGRMRLSPLSRKLEDGVRVEVGKKTEFVTIDCVRLPGGGDGQKPQDQT